MRCILNVYAKRLEKRPTEVRKEKQLASNYDFHSFLVFFCIFPFLQMFTESNII